MESNTKLIWSERYQVHAGATDYRSKGKLSFLLDIMQSTADAAVHGLGLSLEKMLAAGMGWMLITLDLELQRLPRLNEHLEVRTWSKGTKGALWQRDYRIFDGEGLEIAAARTIWALVDTAKRKILRPNALPVQVEYYTGDSVGDIPERVTLPPDVPLLESYRHRIRYSGLDTNGHLNNARYGDLCCDVLTMTEWDQSELVRFRISYLQEAKIDEELIIMRTPAADAGVFIRGQGADGSVYFEAGLEFAPSKS